MAKLPLNPGARFDEQEQSLLDEAIEGLERSWQSTNGGDIAAFVPPPAHVFRERVLVELIKVDQEFRWASGQRRLLEAYLTDWPELGDKAHVARELLEAECLTRATFGSLPTAQELESRFPEISGRVDLGAIAAQVEREQDRGQAADGALAAMTDTSRSLVDQTPSTAPPFPPLTVGQLFGRDDRYKILELLGQGGMGTVYRAYDTRLGRDVALKIPRVDPAAEPAVLERFVRESRATAKIRHPNICPIFDADQFEGTFYLTMALIEGQSLAEWEKGRRVDPRKAVEVVWKLARALAIVHSEGIIHRDIKPSNVMIDRSGEPLLMDFGLARLTQEEQVEDQLGSAAEVPGNDLDREAKQLGSSRGPADDVRLTHTGSLLGTLQYMSPEQTYGKSVGASSDVYSLGVLLYQVLASRLPFEGGAAEILESIRRSEPPRLRRFLPELDTRLEAVCLKAMAKNPTVRFQTAGNFADALQRWLRISPESGAAHPPNRWLRWTAAAGAAFVLLGIVIYIKTQQGTTTLKVNDPTAEITIDRDKVSVASSGRNVSVVTTQGTATVAPPAIPIGRWIDAPPRASGAQLSQDGKTLYMAFSEYPDPSHVQMFDVASGKTLQTIGSPEPNCDHKGLAVSADDRYVYVTNYFRRDISRIDLRDNNRRTSLLIGGVPSAVWATNIGLTPDKRTLVVALGDDGRSEDLDNDQVSIVDIAEGRFSLIGEVRLDDEIAGQIAFSADSKFAYLVTRQRKSPAPILYEVRLTEPFAVTRRLAFPNGQLQGVTVSSRLQRAFVSDSGQRKIWVVDLKTFKCVSDLKLDGYAPGCLTVNDQDKCLYVLSPESRKLFLLDCTDGTVRGRVDGLREGAGGIEVLPDNRRLLVWHTGASRGVAVITLDGQEGGLVFASNRAGEGHQIYQMQFGEKEAVRLTNNHATDRCPRWSPDGHRIAYLSTEPGLPKICITDCKGARPTVLRATDPILSDRGATLDWSPDGAEIAFIGDNGRAIRVVNVKAGTIRTLVAGEVSDGCAYHLHLCWEKADNLILVNSQSSASSHHQGIFLLNPKTVQVSRVTLNSGDSTFFFAPVASPDGSKFAAPQAPGGDRPLRRIYLTTSDATPQYCLIGDNAKLQVATRWSADGKLLAYSAAPEDRYHVYLVDARDKESIQLTSGDYDDIEPDLYGNLDTVLSAMNQAGTEPQFKDMVGEKALVLERIREISDGGLTSLGCSNPASDEFAVIASDGGVRIFDYGGNNKTTLKQRDQNVTALAYSPDGRLLLAGTKAGALLVWHLADGKCDVVAPNVGAEVGRVAWLAGTDRVVWGTLVSYYEGNKPVNHDKPSGAVLDRLTGKVVWQFRSFVRQDFQSLAAAPGGQNLAVLEIPGKPRGGYVLDGSRGDILATLYDDNHGCGPLSVCLSPDGRTLAVGYAPRDVILWDVREAKRLKLLNGHSNWVVSLVFSQDGSLLLSGAGDSTARLWDTGSGKELGRIRFPGPSTYIEGVGLSPKGDRAFALAAGLLVIVEIPSTIRQRPPMGTTAPDTTKKGATLERFQRALGKRWDHLSLADRKKTELAWQQLSENERDAICRMYAAPEEVLASLSPEERKQVSQQKPPAAEDAKWIKSSCPWINLNDLSTSDRLFLAWVEMIRAIFAARMSNGGH